MRCGSIASSLLALSLVGCGGSHLDAKTARSVAVAKSSKTPMYWLGKSYDGLDLVHVDAGEDAFFKAEFFYSDCSWFDLNTLSPKCHRTIEIDDDVPAQGEISSMGRCLFATTIRGVTVTTFPVNPSDIRVFARDATVMVASESRARSLKAIAALKPLNGHPLRHRDVSAALGTCKAPPPRAAAHLTARQRYVRQMDPAFFIAQQGLDTIPTFVGAAKPRLLRDEFVANTANEPAFDRNVADRVEKIDASDDIAAVQAELVGDLRARADVIDEIRERAKSDGLDGKTWERDRVELGRRLAASWRAMRVTLAHFRARSYSTYIKPSD